ncbi:MAG: hypothetical protein OXD00_08770 [Gammaproteobacteria bacterium]|nr:hypothetical protein [Gammaproteobacteria bacterium]
MDNSKEMAHPAIAKIGSERTLNSLPCPSAPSKRLVRQWLSFTHMPAAAFVLAALVAAPSSFAQVPPRCEAGSLPEATTPNAEKVEGEILTFNAQLSCLPPEGSEASFRYSVKGITATKDIDFVPVGRNQNVNDLRAVFPSSGLWGRRVLQKIQMRTRTDSLNEGDETFQVEFYDPVGLTLANTSATGTIKDKPVKPTIMLVTPLAANPQDRPVRNEGGDIIFRLYATPDPAKPLDVHVTISQTGAFAPARFVGRKTFTLNDRGEYRIIIPTTDNATNDLDGVITATLEPSSNYNIDSRAASASVGVIDNDPPAVGISAGASISAGMDATFTFTANPKPADDLRVDVDVSATGGAAASGESGRRVLTIGRNGQGTLRVGTVDAGNGAGGVITATLVRGTRYTLQGSGVAQVDVSGVGGTPTPKVEITASGGIDEGETARFSLSANPPPASSLVVWVDVVENGRFAASGQTGRRSVTIGTDGTGTLSVNTVIDDRDEADGDITARVVSGDGYAPGTAASATVPVTDGGAPTSIVTISAATLRIGEGDLATFDLQAVPAPQSNLRVAVDIASRGGFADPNQTGRRFVTIHTDGRGSISVLTVSNGEDDPDGYITATLAKVGERYSLGSSKSARVDVTDGGAPIPTVTVAPASTSPLQEGDTAVFTLRANPAPAAAINVRVGISETGDYTAAGQTGSRLVTIGTDGTGTLNIATERDNVNERDGTISIRLEVGDAYQLGVASRASIDVSDGDAPIPAVGISAGAAIVEGGSARFTLSAEPAPQRAFEVTVDVSDLGDVLNTADTGAKVVTIDADGTATLRFDTLTDGDHDGGSISVRVQSGLGYTLVSPGVATVNVSDADNPEDGGLPVPIISIWTPSDILEGDSATFILTANPLPSAALDVRVQVTESGQYAASGQTGSRQLTIGTDGVGTLSVMTERDGVDEEDGEISVVLAAGDGYQFGDSSEASVNVSDGAPFRPRVRVVPGANVFEGERASFTLQAIPTPQTSLDVTVDISEIGGAVEAGETGERVVTIGADGTATLLFETLPDADSKHGWITVRVASGTGYAPGAAASAVLKVIDDDTPPLLVDITPGSTIIEGELALFTLTAYPAPAADLLVDLAVTEIGEFLTDAQSYSATIKAGETTGLLQVATIDDQQDESDGLILVEVIDGKTHEGTAYGTVGLRVRDNDVAEGGLSVSIADASLAEGGRDSDGRMRFEITLSSPSEETVTLRYNLYETPDGAGTASADVGADVTLWSTDRVEFAPGETVAYADVRIVDDGEEEKTPETFGVRITEVRGAEILDGLAIGTILPDPLDVTLDTPVITVFAPAAVTEGEDATFKLLATPPSREDFEVTISVVDAAQSGEPGADGDFLDAAVEGVQTVVIQGIGSQAATAEDWVQNFVLKTVDDDIDEVSGPVTLVVQSGTGESYLAGTPSSASVIVYDDDGAPDPLPAVSVSDATASESDGEIIFDVTLNKPVPPKGTAKVNFSTMSGTARAREDYVIAYGTLTFSAGETSKQITVQLIDDDHDDPGETFRLLLTRPQGLTFADRLAVGTITNSDPMPQAWLARFGQAVADQSLSAITSRIDAKRTAGVDGVVAGGPSQRDQGGHASTFSVSAFGSGAPQQFGHAHWLDQPDQARRPRYQGASGDFSLTSDKGASGGSLAIWSRAAHNRFQSGGQDAALKGEVTTGMLGADYARGKWLLGVALTHSRGEGSYERGQSLSVESSLGAAIPYAAYEYSNRLSFWGAFGYGRGDLALTQQSASERTMRTDTDWTMQAAGLKSDVFSPAGQHTGPSLSVVADALRTTTNSDDSMDLAASEAVTQRMRLGLEGSWHMAMPGGGQLTPALELGVRRDQGDAQEGFGVEVGAGLAWSDPLRGIEVNVEGRRLVNHESDSEADQGISAALSFDPNPASQRGPVFTLRQDFGGRASGGLDAMFAGEPMVALAGAPATSRWQAEAAYGFPVFGGRFIGSPHIDYGFSELARDYSVGWRLAAAQDANAPDLSLRLLANRHERAREAPDHGVAVELSLRW